MPMSKFSHWFKSIFQPKIVVLRGPKSNPDFMRPNSEMLTPQEIRMLDLTMDLWRAGKKLPEEHPHDEMEFTYEIHRLQQMIMMRAGRRQYRALMFKDEAPKTEVVTEPLPGEDVVVSKSSDAVE